MRETKISYRGKNQEQYTVLLVSDLIRRVSPNEKNVEKLFLFLLYIYEKEQSVGQKLYVSATG